MHPGLFKAWLLQKIFNKQLSSALLCHFHWNVSTAVAHGMVGPNKFSMNRLWISCWKCLTSLCVRKKYFSRLLLHPQYLFVPMSIANEGHLYGTSINYNSFFFFAALCERNKSEKTNLWFRGFTGRSYAWAIRRVVVGGLRLLVHTTWGWLTCAEITTHELICFSPPPEKQSPLPGSNQAASSGSAAPCLSHWASRVGDGIHFAV